MLEVLSEMWESFDPVDIPEIDLGDYEPGQPLPTIPISVADLPETFAKVSALLPKVMSFIKTLKSE